MIRQDQIPPEVVKAMSEADHGTTTYAELLAAAIAAWPGMKYTGPSGGGLSQEPLQSPLVTLPLSAGGKR